MPKKPEQETAFILDGAAVASDAPVHFANFPGVWERDRPIAASALIEELDGIDTADQLKDHVAAEGYPLTVTNVDDGSAPLWWPDTHEPSEEEVRLGQAPAVDAPAPEAEVPPEAAPAAEPASDKPADAAAEVTG